MEPAVALATALALAWPLASVVAVADESVADAPVAGAVKVTATPLTGLPAASLTSTCSGAANGAGTVVLCGRPADRDTGRRPGADDERGAGCDVRAVGGLQRIGPRLGNAQRRERGQPGGISGDRSVPDRTPGPPAP